MPTRDNRRLAYRMLTMGQICTEKLLICAGGGLDKNASRIRADVLEWRYPNSEQAGARGLRYRAGLRMCVPAPYEGAGGAYGRALANNILKE